MRKVILLYTLHVYLINTSFNIFDAFFYKLGHYTEVHFTQWILRTSNYNLYKIYLHLYNRKDTNLQTLWKIYLSLHQFLSQYNTEHSTAE